MKISKLGKILAIVSVATTLSLALSGCSNVASKEVAAKTFMDAVCPYHVFADKWENKTLNQTVKSYKKYFKNAAERTRTGWEVLSNPEHKWPMAINGEIQLLAEEFKAVTLVLEQTQSMTNMKQLRNLNWPEVRSEAEAEISDEKITSVLSIESDLVAACSKHLGVSGSKPKKDKKDSVDKPKKTKAPETQIEYVEIPNIVGVIRDGEVRGWLQRNGYKIAFLLESTGFNSLKSCMMSGKNMILRQEPAAGTLVANSAQTTLRGTVDCETIPKNEFQD